MFDLAAVQQALAERQLDGWLLCDFRGNNVLARRVLAFPAGGMESRRWAYFIPRTGAPRRLVHRIEQAALDHLPGSKTVYLRWQEYEAGLRQLVGSARRVAMEYAPRNGIPYLARVDAGTVELVRSWGVEPVCSGDLVQLFEACWDEEQWQLHREAARHTEAAFHLAWKFIADRVRGGQPVTEMQVHDLIMDHFQKNGMTTYHGPIVGIGPHSGDPHYETGQTPIHANDFVLIDLWAKMDHPRGVYSDLTWVGFVGTEVPARYEEVFQIVARARDAGIQRVRDAFARKEPLQGWQVDDATRQVIEAAGYGEAFVHRTGHSIGQETHGNGANMDNLETHDERQVLPRTCFSIEPGIYLPEFGVRSEVNVYVDGQGGVHVTGGGPQLRVIPFPRD
ncbi:MAG TPA: M24 family metallopeptidase [Gemmatales bacterium]|nr:M24 family metallopeptidase [Gemmatales bacterium]